MNKKELKELFKNLPEEDFCLVIRDLRQVGVLKDAAEGIARQIEARGRASLIPRQTWRFLHDAWFDQVNGECSRCCGSISPEEMVWSRQLASDRCSYCQHQWEKLASE